MTADAADRVRTLLLRADNLLKNEGDQADRERRAIDALLEAREVAALGGVDERVADLIERRLSALEPHGSA
jgi:flagellar biosynthesis regulator FlaF